MEILKGFAVSQNIIFGKLFFFKKEEAVISTENISDCVAEKKRFFAAQKKALEQLDRLYDSMDTAKNDDAKEIFQIHKMMLEDEDFLSSVTAKIEDEYANAVTAIQKTAQEFIADLQSVDDEYIKGRVKDIEDIAQRLIAVLCAKQQQPIALKEPVIIVAKELTPSDIASFSKDTLRAIITTNGAVTSHLAIIANSLGIPALLGTGFIFSEKHTDCDCIIDETQGTAYLVPDKKTIDAMEIKRKKILEVQNELQTLIGIETKSISGKKIKLFANAGSLEDIEVALKNDAEGIGLFRTEVFYLNRTILPAEQELFEFYKTLLEKLGKKPLTVRTLDIGSDKISPYLTECLHLKSEENPALGIRGIRVSLFHTDIFITQLRALLRASVFGNMAIMFPMIIAVDEVKKIKEILYQVQSDLKREKIPFDENIQIGIMIETPAAALLSDELAPLVDFFSIGTNDLVQYCLAIDRQNTDLMRCYDTHSLAVLRLIEMTIANAHKHRIKAGLCGEFAGELSLTQSFLDMNADYLSVYPGGILPVRKKIRESR